MALGSLDQPQNQNVGVCSHSHAFNSSNDPYNADQIVNEERRDRKT